MAKISLVNAKPVSRSQAQSAMYRLESAIKDHMPEDTWVDFWENSTKKTHVRTSRCRIRSGSQEQINEVMTIMQDYCQNMLPAGSWKICTRAFWTAPMQGSGMTPYKKNALVIWYVSHSR
jgi:hypothetical protein